MKKTLLLILSAFLFSSLLNAQKIDSSFGTNGLVLKDLTGNLDTRATTMAVQSNSKFIVGGYSNFQSPNFYDGLLLRYNEDGTVDNSFGVNGMVRMSFGTNNDYLTSVKIQPDGKIVAAGYTFQSGSNYDYFITRYTSAGIVDSSFGINGYVLIDFSQQYDVFPVIALQPDGKIIIAGGTGNKNSFNSYLIARVTASGAIDSSFGGTGIINKRVGTGQGERATAILVLPDTHIIIGGYCHDENFDYEFGLLSYNSNGTLNTSFGTAGKVILNPTVSGGDILNCMTLSSDNKILAAGQIGTTFGIVKLNTNGSLFTGFGTNGVAAAKIDSAVTTVAYDMKVLPGGKILLGGADFIFAAYNSDGQLFKGFGSNGVFRSNFSFGNSFSSFALQGNKLLASGWGTVNTSSDMITARYTRSLHSLLSDDQAGSIAIKTNISVYPNPANNIIYVSGLRDNVYSRISITNERGQVFAQHKLTGKNVQQLSVSSIKTGVYYLLIDDGTTITKIKFVKE